ncbi:MAG TPA: hypothetical protein VMN36_02395 [Verrucomicrobiales bacterium]|nr:hypothetical protein [Verrucomicrobiales bacterium]
MNGNAAETRIGTVTAPLPGPSEAQISSPSLLGSEQRLPPWGTVQIEHNLAGWPCQDVVRHPDFDRLWAMTAAELPSGWHILLAVVWDGRCFAGQRRVSRHLFRIERPVRQTLSGFVLNRDESETIQRVLGPSRSLSRNLLPRACRKLEVYAAFTSPRLAWIEEDWGTGPALPRTYEALHDDHDPVRSFRV